MEESTLDIVVGDPGCSIQDLVLEIKSSDAFSLLLHKYFALGNRLKLDAEDLDRIKAETKIPPVDCLWILTELLRCWKSKQAENAKLAHLVKMFKIEGLDDFAAILTKRYFNNSTKSTTALAETGEQSVGSRSIDTISISPANHIIGKVSPNSSQTREDQSILQKTEVNRTNETAAININESRNDQEKSLTETVHRIPTQNHSDTNDHSIRRTASNAIHCRCLSDYTLLWSIALAIFLIYLSIALISIRSRQISRSEGNKFPTANLPNKLNIAHPNRNGTAKDLFVGSYREYQLSFNSYSVGSSFNLFIETKECNDWNDTVEILHADKIRRLNIKGPIRFSVVANFLLKSSQLEALEYTEIGHFNCDNMTSVAGKKSKKPFVVKNIRLLRYIGSNNCSQFIQTLAERFSMPNLVKIDIRDTDITETFMVGLSDLADKPKNLSCLMLSSNTEADHKFPIQWVQKLDAKQVVFDIPTYKPYSLDKKEHTILYKLCIELSKLQVLIASVWFLPLDVIYDCSQLRVLNISLDIDKTATFESVEIFSQSFSYLEHLKLNISFAPTTKCKSTGFIGIEELKSKLKSMEVVSNSCFVTPARMKYLKFLPDLHILDFCQNV